MLSNRERFPLLYAILALSLAQGYIHDREPTLLPVTAPGDDEYEDYEEEEDERVPRRGEY